MRNPDDLETIADRYLAPNATMSVDAKFIEILARRTVDKIRGPRVLEMGLGADAWTAQLIEKFGHSHLVDGSCKLISAAKEKYGAALTDYNSLFETFSPPEPFDAVLATLVLEHVDDPVSVLRRMREWITPGGQILIIVPNANSIHRIYGMCLGLLKDTTQLSEADHLVGHRRVYTPQRLQHDVVTAGLKVVKWHPTYIKFLSNAQMQDYSQQQFETLFDLAHYLPTENSGSVFLECTT